MGKKSRRRAGPRETSAAQKAAYQRFRELAQAGLPPGNWAPPEFVPYPQPGEGVGRGRSYDANEISPWKQYCANCYAGAVVYTDYSSYDGEEYTYISPPKNKCSNCRMVWYCNRECQSEHWQWHKRKCKASTGTKEERKEMKRRARRWERENDAMLKPEREKLQFQKDKVEEQREFLEQVARARAASGEDYEEEAPDFPSVRDHVSSDEDE